MFKQNVTFTPGGPTELIVSATIINDMIAFEDDEVVTVNLTIVSPITGLSLGSFPTTVVIIVDDESKFAILD